MSKRIRKFSNPEKFVIKKSLEQIHNVALKYECKGHFQKYSRKDYCLARDRGWLELVCSHMVPKYKSWNFQKCKDEALKYKTLSEFTKKSRGGYMAATRMGILEEICSHMPNVDRAHKRMPIETVISKIKDVHADQISIVEKSYVKITEMATFIDIVYGTWEALVDNILRGRSHPKRKTEKLIKTSNKRYGVDYPAQNREIGLKTAKNSNIQHLRTHWKTGEELVCQASWEPKVVDYLNSNKIDFLWQPKTFKMPNGKTYRPDLFLVNENKWIEIKGYMRPKSKIKWDWFLTQHPNSELWNESRLREMGILNKK